MKFKFALTIILNIFFVFSFSTSALAYPTGAGQQISFGTGGGPGGVGGDGGVSLGGRVLPPWAHGRSYERPPFQNPYERSNDNSGNLFFPEDGGVSLGGLIWKIHSKVRCEAQAQMIAEKIGHMNIQKFSGELYLLLRAVSSGYWHSNNRKSTIVDYLSNEQFLRGYRDRVTQELPDLIEYNTITDCNDPEYISNARLTLSQKQDLTTALDDLIRNIRR